MSLLTESFDVAVFTVYSVLMNVNNLFTLSYLYLFQIWYCLVIPMIPQYLLHFRWPYVQFMNTRLVTMSVSLCTQTGLHCLIIQVLHTRVWFLNASLTSVHSNLEHGLAILTESFSPLRSVLHNLSCWSPKQKSTSIDTQYNFLTSVALHNIIQSTD